MGELGTCAELSQSVKGIVVDVVEVVEVVDVVEVVEAAGSVRLAVVVVLRRESG